jgi:hypothetical protein
MIEEIYLSYNISYQLDYSYDFTIPFFHISKIQNKYNMKRNYLRESQCEFKNLGTNSVNLYRPRTALFFSNQKNTSEEST